MEKLGYTLTLGFILSYFSGVSCQSNPEPMIKCLQHSNAADVHIVCPADEQIQIIEAFLGKTVARDFTCLYPKVTPGDCQQNNGQMTNEYISTCNGFGSCRRFFAYDPLLHCGAEYEGRQTYIYVAYTCYRRAQVMEPMWQTQEFVGTQVTLRSQNYPDYEPLTEWYCDFQLSDRAFARIDILDMYQNTSQTESYCLRMNQHDPRCVERELYSYGVMEIHQRDFRIELRKFNLEVSQTTGARYWILISALQEATMAYENNGIRMHCTSVHTLTAMDVPNNPNINNNDNNNNDNNNNIVTTTPGDPNVSMTESPSNLAVIIGGSVAGIVLLIIIIVIVILCICKKRGPRKEQAYAYMVHANIQAATKLGAMQGDFSDTKPPPPENPDYYNDGEVYTEISEKPPVAAKPQTPSAPPYSTTRPPSGPHDITPYSINGPMGNNYEYVSSTGVHQPSPSTSKKPPYSFVTGGIKPYSSSPKMSDNRGKGGYSKRLPSNSQNVYSEAHGPHRGQPSREMTPPELSGLYSQPSKDHREEETVMVENDLYKS